MLNAECPGFYISHGLGALISLYQLATREFLIDSLAGGPKLTSQHDGTP